MRDAPNAFVSALQHFYALQKKETRFQRKNKVERDRTALFLDKQSAIDCKSSSFVDFFPIVPWNSDRLCSWHKYSFLPLILLYSLIYFSRKIETVSYYCHVNPVADFLINF